MTHMNILRVVPLIVFATMAFSACGSLSPDMIQEHPGVVAENLGPDVNSPEDDFAMFVDRERMYFTTNRPTHEGYIQGDDIWFTDREGAGWTKALNYGGKINTTRDEGAPFVTADGEDVYFVQCWTEDGLGDCDIYVAKMDYNGKWQQITNLGDKINSKDWDSQPFISPDGEYLYFASDRDGGYGGTDIWRSKRLRSGKWGTPKNLGPEINTGGDEKSPMVAPNGIDLFFSSTGHEGLGGYDLYRSSETKNDRWTPAQNVGRPFNSAADDMFWVLSAQEDTVYIASSRTGGEGGLDIHSVWPNPYKDTTRYIYYVRGMVYDTVTTMAVSKAVIRVQPEKGAEFVLRPGGNGRYQFRTELGRNYRMTASAEGYESATVEVNVPSRLSYNEYRKSIGLSPIAAKVPDVVPADTPGEEYPVTYFEFDKSNVRPEYREELKRVFDADIAPLVTAAAPFTVTLDAHTDDRGTEQYNYNLSRRRGAAVSKVLRDFGVPLENIRINAYGETRPVVPGEDEEAHSRNRRVELTIQTEQR
ncbi:MAG: OmpA family protein [Bacteroidota bacterium]|nr:OmpA family protein [Bacteroidota bacterium]